MLDIDNIAVAVVVAIKLSKMVCEILLRTLCPTIIISFLKKGNKKNLGITWTPNFWVAQYVQKISASLGRQIFGLHNNQAEESNT